MTLEDGRWQKHADAAITVAIGTVVAQAVTWLWNRYVPAAKPAEAEKKPEEP